MHGKEKQMSDLMARAETLLSEWKGSSYVHGLGVLPRLGGMARAYGSKAVVVVSFRHETLRREVHTCLEDAGVSVVEAPGARPNAPREDVYRLATYLLQYKPDVVVAVGGGSTIDACKAANVLFSLGAAVTPEIDHYFGSGIVTQDHKESGAKLLPLIAVETSASSGSHLTKYANVTDPVSGQKKLIVDNAITPSSCLFDYALSASMPRSVTIDGILDALSHTYESFCGAKEGTYDLLEAITTTAIGLCLEYGPRLMENLDDLKARKAIGLATDLGGYAIMVGGTSGGHLTSFSLVKLVGHGTACGIMNPYYTIYYSASIQKQLHPLLKVYAEYGYASQEDVCKEGRDLALAASKAMIAFARKLGAPTTLGELKGFSHRFVDQALQAAKDSQLAMKLQNMPVPMQSSEVDTYMAPILEAAVSGDFSLIKEKGRTLFPYSETRRALRVVSSCFSGNLP